ncbi:MAG: SDR family NAD(P)-dependent oxidoreductase [Alphaproteobacteria bacterium]|nr:SDR family NAD(P)-dependent oxidoreductase [Alphaproteobacteria bacterium]
MLAQIEGKRIMADTETALIVGAGPGLSAAVARLFASEGMTVALAARHPEKLADLTADIGATAHACDAADSASVASLFDAVTADMGTPDVVLYNPSSRVRGAIETLDPEAVRDAILISCFGGFLVGQAAAKAMIQKGSGTILFTGASASIKGYANSSCFAMGKFGLRGLAQSMARELQPKNIHVAHFVIDGGIAKADDPRAADRGPDGLLLPDEIAKTYLHAHRQHRSAWTFEFELRPWVEKF